MCIEQMAHGVQHYCGNSLLWYAQVRPLCLEVAGSFQPGEALDSYVLIEESGQPLENASCGQAFASNPPDSAAW